MNTFKEIYNPKEKNHLLIGNGFNLNFGYRSNYESIFEKMKHADGQSYDEKFSKEVEKYSYDLELVLENHSDPLAKKAIKTDFIKALMKTVQDAENNTKQASEFISHFDNIFTLNYDPFLYKIGLHIERKTRQASGQYADLIDGLSDEFSKINFPKNRTFDEFNDTEKSYLYAACASVRSQKVAFRKEAMTYLTQKEATDETAWKMEDGFTKWVDEFIWEKESPKQNLFYLHGALHIYKDNEQIKKISVGRLDTLKSRIIDRIDESAPLDVIFKSKNKENDVINNPYMNFALEKLKSHIEGNLFLYGVSLSENDSHVWNAIKSNTSVENIYVSVFENHSDQQIQSIFDERAVSFASDSINK